MPGTGADQYPNWCVPLCDSDGEEVFIEDLPSNERLTSLFSPADRIGALTLTSGH